MSAFAEQLEQLAEQETAGIVGTDVVDDLEVTAAEDYAAAAAVDAATADVDNATEAAVSLESFVSRFMSTCPKDEWNRATAYQYEEGCRAILRARGVTVPSELYAPSFESAETKFTKGEHYEETRSRTKAFFVKIYQAIKAAIQAFFKSIQDWMHRQRITAAALRKAADELDKGVADASRRKKDAERRSNLFKEGVDVPKEIHLKGGNYLGGGDGEAKHPAGALAKVIGAAKDMSSRWGGIYSTALSDCIKGLEKGEVPAHLGELIRRERNTTTPKLPGGISISFSLKGEDPLHALRNGKFVVVEGKGGEGSVLGLSTKEITETASAIRAAAEFIDATVKHLNGVQRDVDTEVKKIQAAIDKHNSDANESDMKKLAQAISPIATRTAQGYREVNSLVGDFARKTYLHCKASFRNFGHVRQKFGEKKAGDHEYR